jgi:hypothetical protein
MIKVKMPYTLLVGVTFCRVLPEMLAHDRSDFCDDLKGNGERSGRMKGRGIADPTRDITQ